MAQTESSQGMIRWLGSIGIINHVMIFPFLLQTAGKDSWIAVIDPAVPLMSSRPRGYYVSRRTGNKAPNLAEMQKGGGCRPFTGH